MILPNLLRAPRCLQHDDRVTQLETKRWTRYGKDRVYVSTLDGQRVGWLDLQDGSQHLEDESLAAAFCEAIIPFQRDSRHTPGVTPDLPSVDAAKPAEPAAPAWQDLDAHVPGQLLRAEAQAQQAELRERSRVGVFLARAFDIKTDERAYRVGAKGEEAVGARLEKLEKQGWHVLHSIPVGTGESDLDHLLIGPGGCFTVNTKNHPGKQVWVGQHVIKVNGHNQRYLQISRYEADRARKLLTQAAGWEVPVKAVLVILTGTVIPQVTIKQMPADVTVLGRMDIPSVLKRADRKLTSEQVEQVFSQARRSTLWRA